MYTSDKDLAFSLSDVISIEKLIIFKMTLPAAATSMYCFLACVNTTLGKGKTLMYQITIAD
jgi:hypothetical protein